MKKMTMASYEEEHADGPPELIDFGPPGGRDLWTYQYESPAG